MHLIYDPEIMQDKADAIREACHLPASRKMTPPEMADVLLENLTDPGLVFRVTDLKTDYSGLMIDPFFYEHFTFDGEHSGLDHKIYNKLKIDFNIEKMSYILQDDPEVLRGTEADYKARYAENYKCADNITINSTEQNPTPLNPLIFSRQEIGRLGTINYLEFSCNLLFMSVYQSETSGLVYCFHRAEGRNIYGPNLTDNNYVTRINRILKHCENKTVSIIFYKNNPDIYSVYVDDAFQFTDNRVLPGISRDDSNRSIGPVEEFTHLTICNFSDTNGGFGFTLPECWFPYNHSFYAAESFNLISMQYIK